MIVYVESNFVLELAYFQEEHEFCERLLELATLQKIQLVIPAYCIAEPYHAWVQKAQKRKEISQRFADEIKELSRSKPYAEMTQMLQPVPVKLLESSKAEKRVLDSKLLQILSVALVIPLEKTIVESAIGLQISRGLLTQDSIVYASVLAHLKSVEDSKSCFITKNSNDFGSPEIMADLVTQSCKLLFRFQAGLGYIQSQL
jgi:predicted nucleic acid-binding protein